MTEKGKPDRVQNVATCRRRLIRLTPRETRPLLPLRCVEISARQKQWNCVDVAAADGRRVAEMEDAYDNGGHESRCEWRHYDVLMTAIWSSCDEMRQACLQAVSWCVIISGSHRAQRSRTAEHAEKTDENIGWADLYVFWCHIASINRVMNVQYLIWSVEHRHQ